MNIVCIMWRKSGWAIVASIYFVEDIDTLRLGLVGKTLCLHHKKYKPAQVAGAITMPFSVFHMRYKAEPKLLDVDNIVFSGVNRIITPSNRTDPVFEVLFSGTRMNKISVDVVPFISVPWRMWFHFGITNNIYGRYGYSYAAETDYNKFRDGISEYDPFSLNEMLMYSHDIVSVQRGVYFTNLQIITMDVAVNVVAEYEDLRDELLETEPSITPVLRKLSKFAQSCCKQRYVPQPHFLFNRPHNLRIIKTNLRIDDYLTDHLLSLIHLTNAYLEALRE